MNSYKELLHQERLAARKAEADAAQAKALYEIYEAHRDVTPCDANDAQIIKYFNGDEITLEAFDHSYQNDSTFRAKLAHRTIQQAIKKEETDRVRLIEDILELMCVSPASTQAVRNQLQTKPTPELEARLLEIREKLHFQSLPKEELKAVVVSHNQSVLESKQRRYPVIPLDIQSREIKQMTAAELKKLIQTYSSEAVTARLRGTDHKEQERILRAGISF